MFILFLFLFLFCSLFFWCRRRCARLQWCPGLAYLRLSLYGAFPGLARLLVLVLEPFLSSFLCFAKAWEHAARPGQCAPSALNATRTQVVPGPRDMRQRPNRCVPAATRTSKSRLACRFHLTPQLRPFSFLLFLLLSSPFFSSNFVQRDHRE